MRQILMILVLIPTLAMAQSSKEEAQEHLVNLKNGALLVRLPTSQYKLKALIESGKEKEAHKEARKQHMENLKLYVAFSNNYTFSKVYFFYNLSSDAIRQGNFKGHLLNEQLEPDPELDYEGEYYIAEFDVIQPTGLSAMVIKDKNFDLLQRPFPYYVKKYGVIPIIRQNVMTVVGNLNNNLHSKLKEE